MLNIIVGPNASGKTIILEALLNTIIDAKNVVTNLRELITFTEIPYSQERIELLEDNIDALCIAPSTKHLLFCEDAEYSDNFMQAITYLCKDVDNMFLDEIDNIIPYREMHAFANALLYIGKVVTNLWIVTHEDALMVYSCEHIKYYTVIKEDNKFKLRECRGKYLQEVIDLNMR